MLRRTLLQAIPLPLAAAPARTVRLGVRAALYQAHPIEEAARRIRRAGFEAVQIGLRFQDCRFDMLQPDFSFGRRAREAFGAAGLSVSGIDGYVNLLHTDAGLRARNHRALAALLERAREFGAPVVATETGGLRGQPVSDDAAGNWKMLIACLRELVKAADAGDSILAIEPSFGTYLRTVEMVRSMLDEVASPRLKILWDGAHLVQAADFADNAGLLQKAFAAFGSQVVLAHANDVRMAPEGRTASCRAGTGSLDYRTYVSLLEKTGREVALCVEHAKEEEIPEVLAYLARFLPMRAAGRPWTPLRRWEERHDRLRARHSPMMVARTSSAG